MPRKDQTKDADALRRGWERISPDAPFAIDFSDPHNPVRSLTKAEQAAGDDEQAAAAAGRTIAEEDRAARAVAGLPPAGTPAAPEPGA